MSKGLHCRNLFTMSAFGLSLFGLMVNTAIAQVPPDVVIEQEPVPTDSTGTSNTGDRRFSCQLDQGRYTVMYSPESAPSEMYPWAIPQSMGGGWTAERRCNEVARRLEMYRSDGLVELTTSTENNYDIVCVTTEADNTCQIVFTVPPGQNAIATRDSVFSNLASADDGRQTQGVNTFTENNNGNDILGQLQGILGIGKTPKASTNTGYQRSSGISLKPFLDRADGGTGEKLSGSNSQNSQPNGRQLNPNLFR